MYYSNLITRFPSKAGSTYYIFAEGDENYLISDQILKAAQPICVEFTRQRGQSEQE